MLPQLLAATVCILLLCSCANRKEAVIKPSDTGPSKSATPSERLNHFFPAGVDWDNATPIQISEAVRAAVKSDPDGAADVVTLALDQLKWTGRFPVTGGSDRKATIDPEPKRTLFDVLFPRKRSPHRDQATDST